MAIYWQVFWRFLVLGLSSFGGPAAHLGYFQHAFVQRLAWLDEAQYARLVALSQFLPGPGSSQVGFAIGLHRAGLAGGLLAFLGFTTPSFLLMLALAYWSLNWGSQSASLWGLVAGLKLLAVVVVADACWTMFRSFCKTTLAQAIAVLTAVVLLLWSHLFAQILVLILAALLGFIWGPKEPTDKAPVSAQGSAFKGFGAVKTALLVAFVLMLLGLPLVQGVHPGLNLFSGFFQAGSLVFGGGHVVLPLLEQGVASGLGQDQFLTGYAAAQAVPGPMFSLAAYLGANLWASEPLIGAALATLAIFLPGLLLMFVFVKHWQQLAAKPALASIMWAINAAVVGLLISALYQPVFQSAVSDALAMAAVILGLFLLRTLKLPIIALVILFLGFGLFRAQL